MVTAPEADGNATNSVPFRTKALPPSITLNVPVPVRINVVKLRQPLKGYTVPLMVADAGKDTLTRLVQFWKALSLMEVTAGKDALVRLVFS